MQVTIIAVGSRGDVQPYVALALGLQAAGHGVTVATHDRLAGLVEGYGVRFARIAGEVTNGMWPREDAPTSGVREPRHFLRAARALADLAGPAAPQAMQDAWDASLDADVIVGSPLGVLLGVHVAEKVGVPLVRGFYVPLSASRSYPGAMVPGGLNLGGQLNLASHHLTRQLLWAVLRVESNRLRHEVLGLPPLSASEPFGAPDRHQWPLLYAISTAVVPRPPDWPSWVHQTGYWFVEAPQTWSPPPGLVDFIGAGPAPISVGFGSMRDADAEELTEIVLTAVRRSGRRAVLLTGWGSVAADGQDDLYVLDEAPHDWLFPRMAGVVHHGGAGTTAAGLRAGVPSVIVPFFLDQPFWGRRVEALGAGPPPILRRRLDARRLERAITRAVGDAEMRRRAAAIGVRIRAEDGVTTAVRVLEAYAAGLAHGHPTPQRRAQPRRAPLTAPLRLTETAVAAEPSQAAGD